MSCSLVPWSPEKLQDFDLAATMSIDQGARGRSIAHPLGSDIRPEALISGTSPIAFPVFFSSADRRLVVYRTSRTSIAFFISALTQGEWHEMRSKCPAGIRAFNGDGNVVLLACDQWKCESCRIALSYRWGLRVRYGMALWPGECFHVTLTLPGQVKTPAFGFFVLKRAWDNYRKAMQRTVRKFDYAAFVELHPKRLGIAHFHIIALQGCPERINDFAHHAGFGFKATQDPVEGWKAAWYVAKYTSKQGDQMPKGFRRVRLSRRWPKLPDPIYDVPIYPPAKNEELDRYIQRIHRKTGVGIPDLQARWQYPQFDL